MRTQPSKIVRRGRYFAFVIFIFGKFRLTAATTEACSGFPELLAKASRACAASGTGYFLVLFSTKSDFGSFFLAAVVSLAINDDSPPGRTCRNFCFDLPTDSVHPKLSKQQRLLPSRRCAEGLLLNGTVLRPLEKSKRACRTLPALVG